MKKRYFSFLLLFALFFHIVHDTLLVKGSNDTKSIHTYVKEQISPSQSAEITEHHHLFHFVAIVTPLLLNLLFDSSKINLAYLNTLDTPTFYTNIIKPPIV